MISRYDPLREALSLRKAMDQLFDQSFVNPSLLPGSSTPLAPMDVRETKDGYEVDVALPGVRPEDIELTLDQNTLTIRGQFSQQNEHESQSQGQTQAEQHDGGQQGQQPQQGKQGKQGRHRRGHNWLAREIVYGSFERTVTFPRPIDANKIQTTLHDGILTIRVPFSEASRPKRISLTGSQSQATSSQGQLPGSQSQATGSQAQSQQTAVGSGQKPQG